MARVRSALALALLVVTVVGAVVATGAGGAGAVTIQVDDDPGTTGDATAGDAEVSTLRLVEQTATVTGNGVYSAVVDIGDADDDVELVVNVLDRVANRSQFRLSTTASNLGTALATLPPRPVGEYERNANGSISVLLDLNDGTIPFEDGQVRLLTAGVYPVLFELRTAAGVVVDQLVTHIVRLPDPGELATIDVAVVLPVGVAPGHRADGRIGLASAARERVAAVVDAIDRNPEVPVTLDIVPETLATLSSSADPTDRFLGSRLVAGSGRRLVLDAPYVDVDTTSLAAAGLDEVAARLETTGTETLTSLLGRAPRELTWIAPNHLTAAGVRHQLDRGVREFVVAERAIVDIGAGLPTGPIELDIGAGRTVDALVVDEALRAYFDGDDAVLAAESLLAELWLVASGRSVDDATAGIVIVPPEDWTPNPALLSLLLDGIGRTPGLRPVLLDELFDLDPAVGSDGRPITRDLIPRVQPPWNGDLDLWERTDTRLDALASMVVDDEGRMIVADMRARLLPSFSSLLRADDAEDYWLTVGREIATRLDGLTAPPTRSFTLTSREDEIPLRVRNDGPLALQVLVRLTSDKLEFPQGSSQQVIVPPGDVIDVPIDVRVKTSGAFPVEVEVVAADGSTALDTSRITVRSTVLSGLGVILTAAALGLLGVWWLVDHHRRRVTAQLA